MKSNDKKVLSENNHTFFNSQSSFAKYNRWLWILSGIGLLFGILIISIVAAGDIPDMQELENPKYDLASVIYDLKGEPFGRYYIEDRVNIGHSDLSPHVAHALISTEDSRFYKHSGVDLRALARVGFKTLILSKESSGGGSTISQQLAKLLYERPNMKGKSFLSRSLTLVQSKLKEWVVAVKLEKSYTKEEIMAMYLNKFEFINGAHGIEAAANVYFNKNQKDLTVSEAATLVGMLKNPSLYNPVRFPERCRDRRNTVLGLLAADKYISKEEFDSLINEDVDMTEFSRKTQSEGPAPYFRAELTKFLRKLLADEGIRKSDGSEYNVYTDGLKIYTSIDLEYQKYAEEAVLEYMQQNQERYDRVWKDKDPWTWETDDYQKKLRASVLLSQCKGSERYLSLRNKSLGRILGQIDERYPGIPMSDNVIKTLDSISLNKTSFHKAVESGRLDVVYQGEYNRIINDSLWMPLITKYKNLEETFEEVFNTPVKMKVFDYENGEKEIEMSPYDSVRYHKRFLQAGLLAVDPITGFVKAWVGGIDHKYFKYDHASMRRSVGSTIKPFIYTQAMAVANISPCQEFDDIQYTISPSDYGFKLVEEWSPANADERFTGNKYNLYQGLRQSKNSITVRLLKEMGTVAPIRDLMNNLGIDKNLRLPNGRLAVPEVPSISLGAVDLTLMEMTGSYTAFANNGSYTEPIIVTRIEDKNGRVIYHGSPKRKAAINPLYNAVMVSMLKNNIGGTMGVKSEIGGKTGTTNDYADAWFMSVTPSLVTGVWVGGDDKWIRFLNLNDGQGSRMAKPITSLFIKKLESHPESGYDYTLKFTNPPAGYNELVDCAHYQSERKSSEIQGQSQENKQNREVFDEEF